MRRVTKGPGRRPQSAKRARFMELRARGWPIATAGREVGVSRTTAANWARGYKVYRGGRVVGTVAPLDPLAVRVISARYLSQDERITIAPELGRAPSTISREMRRNVSSSRGYRPFEAHRQATRRRAKPRCRRLEMNLPLRELVGELLAQR
ncbi:helix-turn-helix domain-containing protein [Cellulomonas xiejunii]|uniref:Helix-turn-helix domain-containing protein n=1 Tax=Cellulomonas xiejunii TaxID=2968083 RepID=A0ABY5KS85_9CELL|nr:helix-turn-helix domain-containing protein [Cellulomonas xiejunii]MCC2321366.1 helix-turn-helix domain-containing protein [Cellulomonas xiejunii]UUI71950.1 helix-turn-helix domain-containing protein [Cellulomonas xiejunii]